MGTTALRMVERCNKTDGLKVAALAKAYSDNAAINPAVLIDFGSATYALSGSHRLDAIQAIYGEEIAIGDLEEMGLVIIEDGNELYENGSGDARDWLEELLAGRGGDMADGIRALWDGLYASSQAALEDQLY